MYNRINKRYLMGDSMDYEKLSIRFIRGYERQVDEDGLTQFNKVLPYLSIVYPHRGMYSVCVEDGPYEDLDAHDGCFIVAPHVRHTIVHKIAPNEEVMTPRWIFITVLFDGHLDVTSRFSPPLVIKGEKSATFRRLVDEALHANDDEYGFTKLRIAGEILENLLEISDFTPRFDDLLPIDPALSLIQENCGAPLTADNMAAACHMSRATFFRTFLRTMGKTPFEYLMEKRLSRAAQLLINTNLPLSTVAKECGFCDEFYLSKCFKRTHGTTPSEYRKHGAI